MKHIKIPSKGHSGVACLAMVCDLSMEEVLEDFYPDSYHSSGFYLGRMLHYLTVKGYLYQHHRKCWMHGINSQESTIWPPAPFANKHILETEEGYVTMDADSRIFDPRYETSWLIEFWKSMHAYSRIFNVIGIMGRCEPIKIRRADE